MNTLLIIFTILASSYFFYKNRFVILSNSIQLYLLLNLWLFISFVVSYNIHNSAVFNTAYFMCLWYIYGIVKTIYTQVKQIRTYKAYFIGFLYAISIVISFWAYFRWANNVFIGIY